MPPLKNIVRIVIIVGVILLIPLVMTIHDGAVEGVGWNWTPIDFAVMGTLLFVTGLAIDFAVRKIADPLYRVAAVIAIVFACLAIWGQLAVGAVSQLVVFLVSLL
jgi:hypothetical protein